MQFIPLPGQGATQADIEQLMQWGIGPADFELFASREDWGLSLHRTGSSIVFPEDGPTIKHWKLTGQNAPEETLFLDILPSGKVRTINVTGAPVDAALSDETFNIYSQEVAIFYRQHHAYIAKLGGIPCLVWIKVPEAELRRINVKEGVSVPYPISSSNVERQRAFPTDLVLVMKNPMTGKDGVHCAKLNDFANWIAAGHAGTFNMQVQQGPPPAPAVTQPGAPVAQPFTPVPTHSGTTMVGENSWIDWDRSGERFNRDATSGVEVATGFFFQNHQGTIGEGGGWQNFDLQPKSVLKVLEMVGPLSAKRSIVLSTTQGSMDMGVHGDQMLVFSRGGKTTRRDASLFADLIASRTLFTPLSTGAVEPWIAAVNTELDSVEQDLEG